MRGWLVTEGPRSTKEYVTGFSSDCGEYMKVQAKLQARWRDEEEHTWRRRTE